MKKAMPAIAAALLVAVAGLATGIAIGGKETTKAQTVVQTQTVEAAESAEPVADVPAEAEEDGTSVSPEDEGGERFLVDDTSDGNPDNLFLEPRSARIGSDSYPDSIVASRIFARDGSSPAYFEYATGGLGRFRADVGFEPETTDSTAEAIVTIRKNTRRGDKLWGPESFHGASAPMEVDFEVDGATKLVFEFTREDLNADYDFPDNAFVLGRARLLP